MNKKTTIQSLMSVLISINAFAAHPPKNVITMDRAKEIALGDTPGKIKSSELEFEKKQWVYSFDILGKDKKIHEVNLNAISGMIVESKTETPAQEAKEKAEDAQLKQHKNKN